MTIGICGKYEPLGLVRKTRNVLFFDTETLSLNPYADDAKLITTQIKVNGTMTVLKEWDIGEVNLILELISRFDAFANNFKNRKYMPVVTYHGLFDILYIFGRMNVLGFSEFDVQKAMELFMTIKHIDLLQYDNGYLLSLNAVCMKYNINPECIFDGSDIHRLYYEGQFNDIVAHGTDDVNRLYRLVTETPLSDRFFIDNIGVLNGK